MVEGQRTMRCQDDHRMLQEQAAAGVVVLTTQVELMIIFLVALGATALTAF